MDVLRRGWPLSFATPESMSERVAAVLEEQRRRSVQHESDFKQGYRRTHGAGVSA